MKLNRKFSEACLILSGLVHFFGPVYANDLEVLLHEVTIHPNAAFAVELLKTHISKDMPKENQSLLRAKAAAMQEILGDYLDAQKSYEQAYFDDPREGTFEYLFRSARLLFELGDVQSSEEQMRVVANLCKDPLLKKKAIFYLARIMASTDRVDEALRIALLLTEDTNNAEGNEVIFYFLFDMAYRYGREEKMKFAFGKLKNSYFGSPEYRLAELKLNGNRTVAPFPSPSALLGSAGKTGEISSFGGEPARVLPTRTEERRNDTGAVAVQTGSFSMKENAEFMIKDLKNFGFNPIIREEDRGGGKKIYKVLVPLERHQRNTDGTQNVIIRLKEKGVEGFLLFD
jgi:tetratricopeptide (TPR) repeat protein